MDLPLRVDRLSGDDRTHISPSSNDGDALFTSFVADPTFPCVGAKSALNKGRMRLGRFGRFGNADVASLCSALADFSAEFPEPGVTPASFVAMFDDAGTLSEQVFETLLWQQLQHMHEWDARSSRWDPSVRSDAAHEDFSFSIAGRAFFVVGLHPGASRLARRAPVPCLVFNFHDQFEQLKASGKYQGMQAAIRSRDTRLQGFVNPVLARFGDASEARQYSGREVANDWQCPFHAKAA